jgi:hypothetical protein
LTLSIFAYAIFRLGFLDLVPVAAPRCSRT